MKNLSNVWIDVTDLAIWRGSLTGIQRTHLEIAKHLLNLSPVKFFNFVPGVGYLEVELPTDDQFGSADLNAKLGIQPSLAGLPRVKSAIRELVASLTPTKLKKQISTLKSNNWLQFSRNQEEKVLPHPFREHDVIIFLGVTWSVEGHLLEINRIKEILPLKIVSLVYDLIPVIKPHFFGTGFPPHYTNHLIDTIHISDLLLSISESTSSDLIWLMEETKAPKKPIIKIRLGDNPIIGNPVKPSSNLDDWGDFVLSVGTFEVRKNHDLLYKTWDKGIQDQFEMPNLVIAGRPGWLTHDLEYAITNNPLTRNKIFILNDCSDENLKWLYQNCQFTIYPSWYEGWGLPIAESAFEGKLCLASNTSSMSEIAGPLMDYFDPYSTEQLLSKVLLYHNDETLLKEKNLELRNYKPTLWQETSEQVLKVLIELQHE